MDEKLESAVNVAAKAAGMDAEDFIEAVFRYRKKEYELEDIIAWMQDHDISPDTSDIRPEEILEEYYHHGDCNVASIIGAISVTHTQGYVDFDKFL